MRWCATATVVVCALWASFACAQAEEVRPPPEHDSAPDDAASVEGVPPAPQEGSLELPPVEPDPELTQVAAQFRDRAATTPPTAFQDALREENASAALEAIQWGRTPTLACAEARLIEPSIAAVYIPPLDGDPLTLRVVGTQVTMFLRAIEPARFAYARCLATLESTAWVHAESELRERADLLERARAVVRGDDSIAAHNAMLAVVGSSPELVWDDLRARYEETHGAVREDPDAENLEGWQSGVLISTSLLFVGSLLSMGVMVRADPNVRPRFVLGALGVSVGSFAGLMLGRTWTYPDSEWTPHRLMAGAILLLGGFGGGIALFRADLKRRHQIFGASMAASSIANMVWLVGGLGIYRRTRRGLRGQPTVDFSRNHGSIGWTGSF